jgi:hypothetical protein
MAATWVPLEVHVGDELLWIETVQRFKQIFQSDPKTITVQQKAQAIDSLKDEVKQDLISRGYDASDAEAIAHKARLGSPLQVVYAFWGLTAFHAILLIVAIFLMFNERYRVIAIAMGLCAFLLMATFAWKGINNTKSLHREYRMYEVL